MAIADRVSGRQYGPRFVIDSGSENKHDSKVVASRAEENVVSRRVGEGFSGVLLVLFVCSRIARRYEATISRANRLHIELARQLF